MGRCTYNIYENFGNVIEGKKYFVISIDGSWGLICKGRYSGVTDCCVITSKNNSFLCSM